MKKHDVFKRWKKHGLVFKAITGTLIVLLLLVGPLLLLALFVMAITRSDFISVWSKGLLYGLYAAAELGITVYALFEWRTLGSRRVLKVNADLENSHFMTDHEINQNDGFTVTDFSELQNVNDGVLITAERKRTGMDVVLLKPIHSLIIATTGTGKTSAYVSPFIEIQSRTKSKPCMVITDPKGELYARHANTLKKNGYHVHIIDMAMTYRSTLWNPFNDIWRKTAQLSAPIEQVKNKYKWGGRIYEKYEDAEREKKEFTVRLSDEIYVDLQDLIYTACPVDERQQDKSWQQGARDLLFAMALRMWEDVRDGYLPKEKFNLYNLWWNLTEYGKPNSETGSCDVLTEYIDECASETSRAAGMANTVLVSLDRTLTSYLGSVNQYLHWMADGGVAQLTSGNEIEFMDWDEGPNVLFIKIPDAKEGRHGLVTLLLVQMYKALLEKASLNFENHETKDECLKRNCYFLMDEFGSLPKIHRFEKIVPIARSRKIFLMPVIQDYKQLDATYGEYGASIIRNNCNVKIFMGTNDDKTRGEISEACGKQKVKAISYNENKDMSVSTSAQSVPLIYPSELKDLNDPNNGIIGNAVVLVSGIFPIRGKTTPYFKAMDLYGIEDGAEVPKKDFMIFDEEQNRYDITKLIYLFKNLSDNGSMVPNEVPAPPPIVTETVVEESTKRKVKIELTEEQILSYLRKLKGKIDDADFERLLTAELSKRITILDALGEAASQSGNYFLSIEIENILGFLKYNKNLKENIQ